MKRMSYETYAYLKSLLEQRMESDHNDYVNAFDFMPDATRRTKDKAYQIYANNRNQLKNMKEELHDAAASSYKDHPNPEMRKWWGLPD